MLLGIGFGVLLLWGFGYRFPPPAPRADQTAVPGLVAVRVGERPPDFALETLEGEVVRLSALEGTPVLINFWATWCGPCRLEMPDIQQVYVDYAPDLAVLGVNVGETPETIQPFVSELGLTFDILLDPESEISALYRVLGYPTSVLVGANGYVAAVHIGLLTEAQLRTYLEEAGLAR